MCLCLLVTTVLSFHLSVLALRRFLHAPVEVTVTDFGFDDLDLTALHGGTA